MSTWSSGIGKFLKRDPNHGKLGKKIKHWFCKIGLCNIDKCKCCCHDRFEKDNYGRIHKITQNCCGKGCGCHK